jgi:PAS domain S-box-containing protein
MRMRGYLALAVGLCATVWVCLFVMELQDKQINDTFRRDTDKIARDTNVRMQTYFDTLLSMQGAFGIKGELSRADFNTYVRQLRLSERYPGFQAIQFVRHVPDSEMARHTAAVRADRSLQPEGYPGYTVHPASIRQEHYLIEYNEPMQGNENAFGLDLAALPTHLRALELGRDTGLLIATERIILVQDASGQPGFVARLPLFRGGMPVQTVEQRRAALIGFVAIVFRVSDLMREVIDRTLLPQLHLAVYDAGYLRDGGSTPPSLDNLMFDSAGKIGEAAHMPLKGLNARLTLNVGERRWIMQFDGHEGGRYSRNYVAIGLIAGAGTLISALIGALLMMAERHRDMAETLRVTVSEQRALQDSAIVGIVLVQNGRIVRCNRGLEEMMGHTSGTLNGCPSTVLAKRGADDPFQCGADGQRVHAELELQRRDGSSFWCMVNGKVLDAAAPGKGCVWVLSDISDRKKTEAALVEAKEAMERSLNELAAQKANVEMAHQDLSSVLVTLKQAQASLITSEKMASLGALVAGIAHELNTPIGNSLLTATALSDMVADFERKLADGGIRRSALDLHLQDAKTACSIIASSLGRAADLITSFKQVAVDQTSDQRRAFALAALLHDTLATYAAQLRRANCEVKVDVPEPLTLESYPGSVGQVLSNLINNAMLHAFEGRAHGRITIIARETGDGNAVLRFQDNGVGMSSRILHQVFDPFFTTKMGQGGSGLGMNIVYNIVTGVLKGKIEIESAPDKGTLITITLPLRVPVQEDELAAT